MQEDKLNAIDKLNAKTYIEIIYRKKNSPQAHAKSLSKKNSPHAKTLNMQNYNVKK